MALDPRTPVIVGVGQTIQRTDDLDEALDPALLMCSAIGDAAVDAGLRSIPQPAIDSRRQPAHVEVR